MRLIGEDSLSEGALLRVCVSREVDGVDWVGIVS